MDLLVLLIEDDPLDAELVTETLRRQDVANVTTVHATTLSDGLDQAIALNPDLALVDLGLPDAGPGIDALMQIRRRLPHLAVVVVTGNDDHSLGRAAIAAGAQDYIHKDQVGEETLARTLVLANVRGRAYRALNRRNEDLEIFAHAVAHDVKAPLANISLTAELMRARGTADDEAIDNIRRQALRLSDTVDGLLAHARAAVPAPPEEVDLRELVMEARDLAALPDGFTVSTTTDKGFVCTDRIALRQVLQNLLANAVQHHDRDEGRIVVSMQCWGPYLDMRIRDDGPGIQHRDAGGLFRPLHTGASRRPGSGLGLAIVHRLVTSHGGSIRFEPQEGRGACFLVRWPLEAEVDPNTTSSLDASAASYDMS